jgi:hypothetical protein
LDADRAKRAVDDVEEKLAKARKDMEGLAGTK